MSTRRLINGDDKGPIVVVATAKEIKRARAASMENNRGETVAMN